VGVDDSTRGKRAAGRFEVWGDGRARSAEISRVRAVVELIARHIDHEEMSIVASWAQARVE
jgi:uncharacterized protein (DUF2267 family)